MNDYFITKDELTVSAAYVGRMLRKHNIKAPLEMLDDVQYLMKYEKNVDKFNDFFLKHYNISNLYSVLGNYNSDIRFVYIAVTRFNESFFRRHNQNLIDKLEKRYQVKLDERSLGYMASVINYCLPSKMSEDYNVTYEEFLYFCFYMGRIPCYNDDYLHFQENIGNIPVDIKLHDKLSSQISNYQMNMEQFWADIYEACSA